jgi:DNA-binding IclR family transcriptional regulator
MTSPNQTILRGAAVLDLLAQDEENLGVREMARRLHLTRSTTHRLLVSLEQVGLVEQGPLTGKYRLGYKATYWAARSSHQATLRENAMRHMIKLRDVTQETVGLTVRVKSSRTYIAQVQSPHELRRTLSLGHLSPLYAGGPGRALLAFLPDEEIETILHAVPPQKFTARTPTTRRRIWAELHAVRRHGIAAGVGEITEGSATIAAPVRDATGQVIAALSISGPAFRFTEDRRLAAAPRLRVAAEELSRELGYAAQSHDHVDTRHARGGAL